MVLRRITATSDRHRQTLAGAAKLLSCCPSLSILSLEDACNETHHRVWTFFWGRRERAQAALLDRADLFAHDA
jgi:hypothetical protein